MTTLDNLLELAPAQVEVTKRRTRNVRLPYWLIPVSAASFIATLVGMGIDRFPQLGGDEGIYTEQGWAILHGQIAPYTYDYDHPFFGWAQISWLDWLAHQLHIGGSMATVNARAVMVLYAFVACLLVYGIARRLEMRRVTSLLAMLVMGASPLYITMARQVLLDNIAVVWVLLAVYLALDPKKRQWLYGASGACFGVAILSKETVLLLLPALFYLVWTRAYPPLRFMCMAAFTTLGTLIVLIHPLFALLRHELFGGKGHVSIWDNEVKYQLLSRNSSGALWNAHSGRRILVNGWLFYDRWLLTAGLIACLLCLAVRRLRIVGLLYLLWAAMIVKPGGYLPAMYVIVGLPLSALGIGGIADALTNRLVSLGTRFNFRRQLGVALASGLILAFAVPISIAYMHGKSNISGNDLRYDRQALNWVLANVPRNDVILTDDAFFVDLQDAGFKGPWHSVSYYRFDLDPISSQKALPHGWQNVDYVLQTPEMRSNDVGPTYPKTQAAQKESVVVASFSTGGNQVNVLRVKSTPFNHTGATR